MGEIISGTNNENDVNYNFTKLKNPIEATVCFEETRLVIGGQICLEEMKNSWKFGKQIQIVVYGKQTRIEKRAKNNSWHRVEIAIPRENGIALLEEFLKKLKENEKI